MTLSDFAAIGSFVSGIAVLISLIYLALQVRQADKNQRALINQGTIARTTGFLMWFHQPPLSDVWTKVQSGETKFSASEYMMIRGIFRIWLLDLQDHMVQHEAGLTDEITFDHVLAVARYWMDMPLFRVIWKQDRSLYAPELVAFVDSRIEAHAASIPADTTDRLTADLVAMHGELAHSRSITSEGSAPP